MKNKTKLFSFLLALLVCTATAFAAAPSFTDVPANYWASGYIEQAADNGWVNGVGNGKYAPEDGVTGAEFVTMVSRSSTSTRCRIPRLENLGISAM